MRIMLSKGLYEGLVGEAAGAVIGWLLDNWVLAGLTCATTLFLSTVRRKRATKSKGDDDSRRMKEAYGDDLPPHLEERFSRPRSEGTLTFHFSRRHWLSLLATGVVGILLKVLNRHSLAGTVTDSKGQPSSGTKILIFPIDSQEPIAKAAVCGGNGKYEVHALQPGIYKVIMYRVKKGQLEWSEVEHEISYRSSSLHLADFPTHSAPAITAGPYLFVKDLDTLSPKTHTKLNAESTPLATSGHRLIIEGRTCPNQSGYDNHGLSLRRANTVMEKFTPAVSRTRVILAPLAYDDLLRDEDGAALPDEKQRCAFVIALPDSSPSNEE